jgi:ParB family chromosome partitioning protein
MKKLKLDENITKDLSKSAADSFGGNIKMIDISEIKPHKENFYSLCDIEVLAEDIERQGLKHNLVVAPDIDGGYYIISGHRRFEAVSLLYRENRGSSRFLPCFVTAKKTDDEALQDLIMLNATSRIISDSEMLKQYEHLKRIFESKKENGEKFGRIRERIAEILNISNTQVARIENVENNAIEQVKNAIENGEMSISTANEIAKLDENEQVELIENKPFSEIKHKDVKERIKRKNVLNRTQNSEVGETEKNVLNRTQNSDVDETEKNVLNWTQNSDVDETEKNVLNWTQNSDVDETEKSQNSIQKVTDENGFEYSDSLETYQNNSETYGEDFEKSVKFDPISDKKTTVENFNVESKIENSEKNVDISFQLSTKKIEMLTEFLERVLMFADSSAELDVVTELIEKVNICR